MSAIGSVIVIRLASGLSRAGFLLLLEDLSRSCWVDKALFNYSVELPRSLCDTWKLTTVSHLAETDTADAELLVDSMRTTATLATCVTADLELRLARCFDLE